MAAQYEVTSGGRARVRSCVDLAELCTLGLGGNAAHLCDVPDEDTLVEVLRWAAAAELPVAVLGGGSNVVVSDEGYPGLIVRIATHGMHVDKRGDTALVTVAAGEPWDAVVEQCVRAGLAGIECLSGIPGHAGAAPIQNVGAYGQEVADTIAEVKVLDRGTLSTRALSNAECAFGYRSSQFKAEPGRFVVLSVTFALRRSAPDPVRHAELANELAVRGSAPLLSDVRAAVLALRRARSMVLDATDENRRSVGSFFLNPVVSRQEFERVSSVALATGISSAREELPHWPTVDGRVKLAAAWLVERAGVRKGERHGGVGISSRHTLALVHYGGGTTRELLTLARDVRDRVNRMFGVRLDPEPAFLGFSSRFPLDDLSVER